MLEGGQRSLVAESARTATEARESERADIARELHDTVIQPLAALIVSLENSTLHLASPAVTEAYVGAWRELAQEAMVSLRCTLGGLRARPHAELGLPEALQRYLVPQARAQGIRLVLESCEWPDDLPIDWTSSLYLLVREALTNVQKHARATEVAILLSCDDQQVSITIADNGVGFCSEKTQIARSDQSQTGFGLVGMRERVAMLGGQFALVTALGQGTRVEIGVPRPLDESTSIQRDEFSLRQEGSGIQRTDEVYIH